MFKVLMCRPTYFGIEYEINPWMSLDKTTQPVDPLRAYTQWAALRDSIDHHGEVVLIDEVQGLPDMVFTANGGYVRGEVAIVPNFKHKERQPESAVFEDYFFENGYDVKFINSVAYEGQGDHLQDAFGRHWMGSGFRSDILAYAHLSQILQTYVTPLTLVDPRFYHLDTCFCPLPYGELMWYPNAFDSESKYLIRKNFHNRIELSEDDAVKFAANTLCLGRDLFMPEGSEVATKLQNMSYYVHEFDLSEFMKSGGASKCLTLTL